MSEARITVNGAELGENHSRAIRMALTMFCNDMQKIKPATMSDGYYTLAHQVLQMIDETTERPRSAPPKKAK